MVYPDFDAVLALPRTTLSWRAAAEAGEISQPAVGSVLRRGATLP